MGIGYLIVIFIYLVAMGVLGWYFMRKRVHSGDEFMLAGRSLPLWVLMGTLLATWVGSGTVVGGAGFVYDRGPIASLLFFFAGAPIGILVLYFFLAEKVRKISKYTIPEVLEMRYGPVARVLAAICILFAYVGITSYQFIGGGYVLNLTTGMPVQWGSFITAVFIIFLAMTGGLFSVAYTDAISALLILGGLLLGLPFALAAVGGDFFSQLPAAKQSVTGGLTLPQVLGYFLPLFMLILGEQNMYQRFSAAKDTSTAKKSNIGFFVGDIIVVVLVSILASCAIILFPGIKSDTALFTIAINAMPFIVGALVLAASVSFIITTGDSYLLSCSTNVTHDFYLRFFNKEASQSTQLWLTRGVILVLGVLAYALGTFFPSVLAIQMYSYTMYGAAITPAVLAAFLWKRANAWGGISSIILGGAGTLFWELVLLKPMGWNSILFSLPLSVAALVIVSLLTAKPSEETVAEFA